MANLHEMAKQAMDLDPNRRFSILIGGIISPHPKEKNKETTSVNFQVKGKCTNEEVLRCLEMAAESYRREIEKLKAQKEKADAN